MPKRSRKQNKNTNSSSSKMKKKDPLAVALGRRGGLKGGKARALKMTKKERSESSRIAAIARWSKEKEK